MRDTLRNASERTDPTQAATTDDENVCASRRRHERRNRMGIDRVDPTIGARNSFHVDVAGPGSGDRAKRNLKARRQVLRGAIAVVCADRSVDSDDNRRGKALGLGRTACDQYRAGCEMKQLARHSADHDLGRPPMPMCADDKQRPLALLNLPNERFRREPIDEPRTRSITDQADSHAESSISLLLELVGHLCLTVDGANLRRDMDNTDHLDRSRRICKPNSLPACLEPCLTPVDTN